MDDLLSWLRLGESLEALGRPRDALAAYRELMEGLDRALPSARRQDLQLDLQALYQRPMERAAAIILEDGSRVPAEAAIESLLLVDAGRARVLRHSFGGQMDGATVSGEARASRARALAALKAAESAFDEQVNSGDESAHLSRLRRRRDDLRTQLEESDRLLEESSGGGEAHLVDDLSLIQESLEETTALVHYLLGEEEVRAWVVTRDVVRAHRLRISPRGLERMVKKYLDGLRAPETAFSLGLGLEAHPSALARKLHEVLLGPFSREIDGRTRLVIVPDGVLHFVPFECLSPPGREPGRWDELEYLIERMSVVTLPSLGQLQRGEIARRRTSSLVAFAASEESVEGRVLDELSHVEGELDFLAPLFPKARVLRGGEATEAAYRRWAGTATHLHLAGHAEVDDGSPAYSGLVLSSGEDGRAGQLLHAREVRHVPLRCELVMLSACSTGLGPLHRGEGALSLARSFLAAGADAVVMSLWRVLDSSTARFAHDFYRALHDGRSRVDALRDAKLGFLRAGRGGTDDRLAHPWFWAPFVLTDTRLVRE
ncbi:MAG: CHAT domain-containing protein [Acidobacteriota bacterium]